MTTIYIGIVTSTRSRKQPVTAPVETPAEIASSEARESTLPVGRAFLVQLAGSCDPGGEAVRGRVEHVRSGEAAHFQSLPELVDFMLGVLRDTGKRVG